jgi:hypothetical protein
LNTCWNIEKNFRAGCANQTAIKNMIKDFCRAGCTSKTAIQVIYGKMAEQAVKKQLL